MCTFQNQQSELKRVRRGILQRSKLGPMAFIIKINHLHMVVGTDNVGQNISSDEEDTVIFMDDTTLPEVIDVSNHSSGSPVGNVQNNVDNARNARR